MVSNVLIAVQRLGRWPEACRELLAALLPKARDARGVTTPRDTAQALYSLHALRDSPEVPATRTCIVPLDGVPLDGVPLDGVPLDGVPLDGAPLDLGRGLRGLGRGARRRAPGPRGPLRGRGLRVLRESAPRRGRARRGLLRSRAVRREFRAF